MTVDLYRVFPWRERAATGQEGHPLFVPPQGAGRVDNPRRYSVLYGSDSPAAAVAEAYGPRPIWSQAIFERIDFKAAVAQLKIPGASILDLDDPAELVARNLRPSRVITLDRETTQAWALQVFQERHWRGVRWWSYWKGSWGTFAVWDRKGVRVESVQELSVSHPAVREAARALRRPLAG